MPDSPNSSSQRVLSYAISAIGAIALIVGLLLTTQFVGAQSPTTPTPLPASTERTDSTGIKQVYVPAGCFMMGSDPAKDSKAAKAEQPQHQVCISKGYWLDEFDVTNAAFNAFIKAGGYANDSLWSKEGIFAYRPKRFNSRIIRHHIAE